ncbi:hypothetical protein TWF281_007888 [Arthrobotrys megalospora]
MSSGVSCALCGGLLRPYSSTGAHEPVSLLHPRIIGHFYEEPAAWRTTEYIASKGGVSAYASDSVDPRLKLWDNNIADMVLLDSTYKLGRALEEQCQDSRIPCKPCYLMHNECWGLFKIVALRLGVKESELPLYQGYLYKAFSAAAYNGVELIWPHGYHLRPDEALEYRLSSRASQYSYIEPHSIDQVGYSQLQVAIPHVYPGHNRTHKDILDEATSLNIPDFLPLPLEITHKVLCFLPGTDIITLSGIKSAKTLQVPDFVWKSQFNLGAELGYLVQPHFMIDLADTWRAKYMFTKQIIAQNKSTAANLKRRWSIFTDLVYKLRDTENCDEAGLIDLESGPIEWLAHKVDRDQALICQSLPQRPISLHGSFHSDGVKPHASGMLGRFITTGVCISYTGEGKLRFVSGFRFLPGGERLGFINSQDEEYIQLNTPNTGTQVMWVATSKYGVRSILVVPVGVDCTFDNFDDVYVNRRMLRTKPSGIEIDKFVITVGLSEVASIYIHSPDFVSLENLDLQESLIQQYSWSPTIIPVFSKHRIEVDHYSFYSYKRYAPEQARFESASLQHILFTEQNIVRFTCWLDTTLRISGIGVFVEGQDAPLVVGTRTEFSNDVVLEGDEALTKIDLFTGNDYLPVGLSVHTNRGIAFHFIVSGLTYAPRKRTLDAGEGREIVGLFAGFNTSLPNTPRLLALGIITSNLRNRAVLDSRTAITRKEPLNPQLRVWNETTDGICPKDVALNSPMQIGHFISTAPLASCRSLECYVQDNYLGYRITGICIFYGKEADSPQRCPVVLGRLSGTATKTVFEIHSNQGEYILAADVYLRKLKSDNNTSGFSLGVVGVVFWTSSRRKISCGKCQAECATKVISLRISIEDDLILKWVYAENIDYLTSTREI